MVAWMIWIGTKLFGNTEFAVRIGASLSWLIAAFFCFQLARNLYGKTVAFVAVMMFCTLPFFFATGLLMTPDAPLTAAWSGALFFLERALIDERRTAWLGVGLCIGLGMLSKYTIALLGPATLIFILLDPGLRRWLWQPWPYLAAAISAAIFSPVVIWNFLNDWASFSFQGQQRLEQPMHFSLPILMGSILVLLTPVGLVAASRTLFARSGPDGSWLADRRNWLADRRNAFMAIYTLVPLSVFIFFSLFHEVKLNWTGPVWLAILPALAARLVARDQTPIGSSARVVSRRSWLVTVAVTLLIYGGCPPLSRSRPARYQPKHEHVSRDDSDRLEGVRRRGGKNCSRSRKRHWEGATSRWHGSVLAIKRSCILRPRPRCCSKHGRT